MNNILLINEHLAGDLLTFSLEQCQDYQSFDLPNGTQYKTITRPMRRVMHGELSPTEMFISMIHTDPNLTRNCHEYKIILPNDFIKYIFSGYFAPIELNQHNADLVTLRFRINLLSDFEMEVVEKGIADKIKKTSVEELMKLRKQKELEKLIHDFTKKIVMEKIESAEINVEEIINKAITVKNKQEVKKQEDDEEEKGRTIIL
jgi:hypothetical protein